MKIASVKINRRNYGRTPNDHDYCEWLDEPCNRRLLDRLKSAGHRLDELAHNAIRQQVERRWGKTASQLRDHCR